MAWLAIVLGVLGFIAWVICRVYKSEYEDNVKTARVFGKWALGIGVGLAILFFIFASVTVVPPGHVGVKVLFGSVKNDILTEGLHFRNPFMNVKKMTTQTQSYTMSIVHTEGEKQGDDSITTLTKDNLTVNLDITVLYRLFALESPWVYRFLGNTDVYTENLVRPSIRTAIRNSAAKYTASELMGEKRAESERGIQNELESIFSEYFKGRGLVTGLECERVLLRNVKPPDDLRKAIEEKLVEQQKRDAMVYVLERAQKEAEKRVIEAKGIADAQNIIDKTLTKEYLQWYYIETLKSLVNSPNHSTIILPFDQKLVPMLQVSSTAENK